MHSGILNASVVVLAPFQSLIMRSLHVEVTLIINHAIRKITIQNVMSASTLFQRTLLVLLNIGRIHSGCRNFALLTYMMVLHFVAAVSEWSHESQDILILMMAGSSA